MDMELIKYDITDAAISQMKTDYMPLVITDLEDKDQLDMIHNARMVVKNHRVAVEKKRKDLKADALAWGKKVDARAKEIFAKLEPIESHLSAEENKVTEAKKREEERRIAAIREKVDLLKCINIPDTIEGVKTVVEGVSALEISPAEYFEFTAEAEQIKRDKLAFAQAALVRLEDEARRQAELKAEQEQFAKERAQHEKAKAEQAERDRIEREKFEAEKRKHEAALAEIEAERRKLAEEKAAIERAEFEKKAKEDARIQAEKDAKEKADREAAEKIEAERRAKVEAARIEKLRPDRERLEAFAQFLENGISYPVCESKEANQILSDAETVIRELADEIYHKAQRL